MKFYWSHKSTNTVTGSSIYANKIKQITLFWTSHHNTLFKLWSLMTNTTVGWQKHKSKLLTAIKSKIGKFSRLCFVCSWSILFINMFRPSDLTVAGILALARFGDLSCTTAAVCLRRLQFLTDLGGFATNLTIFLCLVLWLPVVDECYPR